MTRDDLLTHWASPWYIFQMRVERLGEHHLSSWHMDEAKKTVLPS